MEIFGYTKIKKALFGKIQISTFWKITIFGRKIWIFRWSNSKVRKVVIFGVRNVKNSNIHITQKILSKIIQKMAILKSWTKIKLTSPSISLSKMWIFSILKILAMITWLWWSVYKTDLMGLDQKPDLSSPYHQGCPYANSRNMILIFSPRPLLPIPIHKSNVGLVRSLGGSLWSGLGLVDCDC